MADWDSGLHERIAAAIKKHRQGAGLTAQGLADRTKELDYPVTRAQIANYESNRKKSLDVAELLIIAAALEVPPLVLIYPHLPSGPVEAIPGQPSSSLDAYTWAAGRGPAWWGLNPPSKGFRLVQAVLDRSAAMAQLGHLAVRRSMAAGAVVKESLEAQHDDLISHIATLEAEIRDLGGTVKDA